MWYFVRPAGAGVEREEYLYIISVFNVSTDSFFYTNVIVGSALGGVLANG